jgi:arginyl-tRNA synthetase
MDLVLQLQQAAASAMEAITGSAFPAENFPVAPTKPEFQGDYTIVLFGFSKLVKQPPQQLAESLGKKLMDQVPALVDSFNVIQGFLNLQLSNRSMLDWLEINYPHLAALPGSGKGITVMVEFSSPNTNKPLHLGHLRNNFLGDAVSRILSATGHKVIKANLVNDRGIHICKSMVAWQLFANGATPASTGLKGDHFVGDYYVKFNEYYRKEVDALMESGLSQEVAEKEAPLMKATQHMLQKWEAGDPDIRALWATMNGWVYAGFEDTYARLGITFDRIYYESNTYLLGRDIVEEGIQKGVFFRKTDGSVWVDLSQEGLDEKLLMRGDGTSVYITQDLGTAALKYEDYPLDRSIYVIADEQNYHMKVLGQILKKLGKPYASGIFHLSYGMVDLTSGRMKSREGTVVDADDLIAEVISDTALKTEELGKVKDFSGPGLQELYSMIGIGAMKFFLLRVNPKKRMVFDPRESIDLNGFTGPFIQYTYARIKSVLRKEEIITLAQEVILNPKPFAFPLLTLERSLVLLLEQFPRITEEAMRELDPSVLASYLYSVAKLFNSFYAELPITRAESGEKKILRMEIAAATAEIISRGMAMLGISVPERM